MGTIEKDVLLAPLTTFGIGGLAKYLIRVKDIEELKAARLFALKGGLPIFILGGGSNVLISDNGFAGLVIKIEMKGQDWFNEGDTPLVKASAGEIWDELVEESVSRNISGLENLSGIPGSVGASVIQNIGAYGAEIKDVVQIVEVLDLSSEKFFQMNNNDCQFDYRESVFKKESGKNLVVLNVTFRLTKEFIPNHTYRDLAERFKDSAGHSLSDTRKAVLEIRKGKFPDLKEVGTAGSFFKNPLISRDIFEDLIKRYKEVPHWPVSPDRIKISAAWLIDKVSNLRGAEENNVSSYKKQSLVIVNLGNATASDVKKFAQKIKKEVAEKSKIFLEEEVRYI